MSERLFEWHQEESHGRAWEWCEVIEWGYRNPGDLTYYPFLTIPSPFEWRKVYEVPLQDLTAGLFPDWRYRRISREVARH